MAIRYGRSDVKQTTAGFRGPLMVQSLTSAKSKFLSLHDLIINPNPVRYILECVAIVTGMPTSLPRGCR